MNKSLQISFISDEKHASSFPSLTASKLFCLLSSPDESGFPLQQALY